MVRKVLAVLINALFMLPKIYLSDGYYFPHCESAAYYCKFRFDSEDGYNFKYPINTLEGTECFTDIILSKDGKPLTQLESTPYWSVTYLAEFGSFQHIRELNPSLSDTQFRPYVKNNTVTLGYENFSNDTLESVKGQCIRVDFQSWALYKFFFGFRKLTYPSQDNCIIIQIIENEDYLPSSPYPTSAPTYSPTFSPTLSPTEAPVFFKLNHFSNAISSSSS
mmetsp:Transcript_16702/g.24730  ORF Transcript_16702/g.24730 Transcript_16702/m.24730 type:complete len:221 (-) Transcript_16702:318-980(-)